MDVLAVLEGRDQRLVARKVGHQPQFDLAVIGRKQQVIVVRGDERLADAAAHVVADGDVLQIGIRRRKASRGRHGLVERGVDAPRRAVDQLGQRLDIGRKQFLHAPVFEDQIDDPVFAGEQLEVVLVGAELLGLGHLGLLGNAHFPEKHLAQLARRVDVQVRFARLGADRRLQFREFAVQLDGIDRQRFGVDPHARHLNVGQHGDHRLLDLEIEVLEADLLDHGVERLLELQRHIGILGGVLLDAFDVHKVHRQLLRAFADERFDLDGLVIEVFLRKGVHVVARLGIEQVVEDHRVVHAAPDRDAQPAQHHQVELDVLPDLGDLLILEQRPHDLRILGRILLQERHVPRFERFHGERQPDDAVVEDVETRGLGVETEFGVSADRGDHLAQLRGSFHKRVLVGRRLGRPELYRLGFGLKFGHRNLLRRRKRHDGVAEQIALSRQRGLLRRGRLGAGHLRQLGLRLLTRTFGKRLGGCEVRQIVHKSLEIQFGEDPAQLVDMRVANREVLLAEGDRHVEADGRQALGQPQVVGPPGDLLALLPGNFADILQNVFHRSPLPDQFAGDLLADARDAGNIVRGIAPQRKDVAHQLRVVDAVLLADGLAVDDLDAALGAPLFVDAAVVAHQLAVILVGRHHIDVVTGFDTLLRKGSDHVVGLVTRHFENRNAHRVEHPFHVGYRKQDVLGGFGTVGLVFRKDVAAEAAALGIERHAQQIGPFAFLDVAQELHEAEHHGGVHPLAVTHRTAQKGIVILENQRIGVDQKEFFHIR